MAPVTAPHLTGAWNVSKSAADTFAESMLTEYRGLALGIASRYHAWTRDYHDLEDLRQTALVGLWQAARSFDASSGTPFGAFAAICIRGRILNWARSRARHRAPTPCDLSTLPARPVPDPPEDPGAEPEGSPRLAFVRRWVEQGRSFKWIGKRLGVPPRLVREWVGG